MPRAVPPDLFGLVELPKPGEEIAFHGDFFTDDQMPTNLCKAGQRTVTVITYLQVKTRTRMRAAHTLSGDGFHCAACNKGRRNCVSQPESAPAPRGRRSALGRLLLAFDGLLLSTTS